MTDIERRLVLGQVSAWDALMECAYSGTPIPAGLLEALERAQIAYNAGECDDLAIPLGVAVSDEYKRAMATLVARRQLAHAAAEEIKRGAKTKPSRDLAPTAFDLVAKRVKRIDAPKLKKFQSIGAKTVEAAYYHPDCDDSDEIKIGFSTGEAPVLRKRRKT